MISKNLTDSIMGHEGFNSTVYRCAVQVLTIGFGRAVEAEEEGTGITEEEAIKKLTKTRNDKQFRRAKQYNESMQHVMQFVFWASDVYKGQRGQDGARGLLPPPWTFPPQD